MTITTSNTVGGAGTFYSTAVEARGARVLSLHDEWTGTIAGTRTLWATNNKDASEADDTDWVDVTAMADGALTAPAGAAGNGANYVNPAPFVKYREKLVVSAGAGVWTSRINLVVGSTRI